MCVGVVVQTVEERCEEINVHVYFKVNVILCCC